jgi:protein-S-isoprenylcysteine O-methyltransferase Ste14
LQLHLPLVFQIPEGLVFWAVLVWLFIPEIRLVRRYGRGPSSAQDAGTLRMIRRGGEWSGLVAFAAAFLPWLSMPRPRVALVVGLTMLLAGGLLRRLCFRTLGRYFTGAVIVEANQPVIDQGPYRWVRHPSYTAGVVMLTGIGVALGSWISAGVLLLMTAFVYTRRVQAEETALLSTIGEPYRTYMARTKRFVPFVV